MIVNDEYITISRFKINLFTPVRQLAESKLIFFAPLGVGVNEENQ